MSKSINTKTAEDSEAAVPELLESPASTTASDNKDKDVFKVDWSKPVDADDDADSDEEEDSDEEDSDEDDEEDSDEEDESDEEEEEEDMEAQTPERACLLVEVGRKLLTEDKDFDE